MPLVSRRDILQTGFAASAITLANGVGPLGRAAALQQLSEAELTRFAPFGNVTLLYVADLHGQLVPVYLREPSVESSDLDALGGVQHLPGPQLLAQSGIASGSPAAHALTADDFVSLARTYG